MRLFLVIGFISFGFSQACKEPVTESRPDTLTIALRGCTDNIFSESRVRLCFDSVISDSRCPANVICVWEGTAVCRFSFLKNGKKSSFNLSTLALPGQYNKDTILSGYKIEFINLQPYPGLPDDSSNSEIKAEVKITKL